MPKGADFCAQVQERTLALSSIGDIQRESFTDGHGLASFTKWYDDLARLDRLDWPTVHADYWADDATDNDRQRRKQAEFLVHRYCPWSILRGIVVISQTMKRRVEGVLSSYPEELRVPIAVRRRWYY